MKDSSKDKHLHELSDNELDDVNGGIDISGVSSNSICSNFYLAAGAGKSEKCGNCFYFHYENGGGYCSHPRFGKK